MSILLYENLPVYISLSLRAAISPKRVSSPLISFDTLLFFFHVFSAEHRDIATLKRRKRPTLCSKIPWINHRYWKRHTKGCYVGDSRCIFSACLWEVNEWRLELMLWSLGCCCCCCIFNLLCVARHKMHKMYIRKQRKKNYTNDDSRSFTSKTMSALINLHFFFSSL